MLQPSWIWNTFRVPGPSAPPSSLVTQFVVMKDVPKVKNTFRLFSITFGVSASFYHICVFTCVNTYLCLRYI